MHWQSRRVAKLKAHQRRFRLHKEVSLWIIVGALLSWGSAHQVEREGKHRDWESEAPYSCQRVLQAPTSECQRLPHAGPYAVYHLGNTIHAYVTSKDDPCNTEVKRQEQVS